jgi:hypothetical protein
MWAYISTVTVMTEARRGDAVFDSVSQNNDIAFTGHMRDAHIPARKSMGCST